MLVTGAGGFVGANLVRRLLRDGSRVVAVIRPGGSAWRLEGVRDAVELRETDLRDEEAVRGLVQATRPEWLFHLSAHGAYSWQTEFRQIAETNLLATRALLHACSGHGCEAFVHAGSSSEYGFTDRPPPEGQLPEPNSEYAVTKAAATLLCRHFARSAGLPTVTLRLYSVYGAFEDPRRLIPTLLAHGLRGELPPLASPDTQRDFVAVADAVEAFVLAATTRSPEPGAVYNVGTGVGTTLAEVVQVARRLLGVEDEPAWGSMPGRPWDTGTWVSDSGKIRAELGWTPERDLERGLAETLEWLRAERSVWEAYGISA